MRDTLAYQFNGQLCELLTYIRVSKLKGRVLGKELAQAIQDEDSDKALSLLNATTHRNIRDNSRTDWVDFLNEHFPEHYCRCSDCNMLEVEDNGADTYDGDYWVCQSCLDDGYSWSDSRDTWITNDDYAEEEEDDEDSVIHSYQIGRAHV